MKRFFATALALAFALSVPAAQSDEVYTFVIKKQEDKAKTRWNLSDWLETRDKMRLMDLWLALHSPSPYEFFVGGAYRVGDLTGTGHYGGLEFEAVAYASIFGLALERESGVDTRYTGLVHLRIFGYHYQSTHIRLEAGIRHESGAGDLTFRQAVAGVGTDVYIGKFFGIEGHWRHAFDGTASVGGLGFSGNRYDGGAFIEFRALRVRGGYVYEKSDIDPANLVVDATRTGPYAGIQLFF